MADMYDMNEALARLVSMQKAALTGVAANENQLCDAVAYWPYEQEAFPYFWNRVNSMTVDYLAQDIAIDRYEIEMGLVIAHYTAGYRGDNTTHAANYIEAVMAYFDAHADMTSIAPYTTPLDNLWLDEGEGAVISGIPGGLRTIQNSGIGTIQVAIGFMLDMPLLREVY